MPSKTKKQKSTTKRVAIRAESDLLSEKINPRSIRCGIIYGRYAMENGRPPEPPPEWRDWKRERFSYSITAAWQFMKGKEMDQLKALVNKPEVTRQRISQMVRDGVKFLMDRRFIVATPPVKAAAAKQSAAKERTRKCSTSSAK